MTTTVDTFKRKKVTLAATLVLAVSDAIRKLHCQFADNCLNVPTLSTLPFGRFLPSKLTLFAPRRDYVVDNGVEYADAQSKYQKAFPAPKSFERIPQVTQ